MANKLKEFKVTSPEGKVYTVNASPDATQEELISFVQSQQEQQAQPSAPVTPAPQASPTPAPQASSTPAPQASPTPAPQAAPVEQAVETVAEMGADTWGQSEYAKPLSDADARAYLEMTQNPNVDSSVISKWLSERGNVWTQESEQQLKEYRKAIAEGREVSEFIDYKPIAKSLLGNYIQQEDTGTGDLGAALEEGMAYNPMGIGARALQDYMDTDQGGISKDDIRAQYPDLSEEALEKVHDSLIGEMRRRELINAGAQVEMKDVNPFVRIGANLVGGSSPVDILPVGRGASLGKRASEAAYLNALADAAIQAGDVSYGAQSGYNYGQTLQAGVEGAALQGGLELAGKGLAAGARALGKKGAPEGGNTPTSRAPIRVPVNRKNSKQYKTQISETVEDVAEHINKIAQDWENAPEYEVHTNFVNLKGVDNDAIGVFRGDGSVAINTETLLKEAKRLRVDPEDVISAVTFHEGLGHYGLTQQFGDSLDDVLADFYDNGTPQFQKIVDDWMSANPDAYKNDARQRERATEEVLAEWSEGGELPASFVDRVTNIIKDLARKAGLDLKVSEREVRTILGMAHGAVKNGNKRDVVSNGFKYATVWHGTPAKFTNTDANNPHGKFDHDYMGSGEGAQVFGWGTYLTETKSVAQGTYREGLSRRGGEAPVALDNKGAPIFSVGRSDKEISFDEWWEEVPGSRLSNSSKDSNNVRTREYKGTDNFKDVLKDTLTKDPAAALDNLIELQDSLSTGIMINRNRAAEANLKGDVADEGYFFDLAERYKIDLDAAYLASTHVKEQERGSLYEVEVPDDATWINWDNGKQSPKVIEAFRKLEVIPEDVDARPVSDAEWDKLGEIDSKRREYEDETDSILEDMESDLRERGIFNEDLFVSYNEINPKVSPDLIKAWTETKALRDKYSKEELTLRKELSDRHRVSSGEKLYTELSRKLGSDKAASEALAKEGIDGTKYLDGLSRSSGEGSYNYVVYDDKTPKITNRYMRPKKLEEVTDADRADINDDDLFEIRNAREIIDAATEGWTPTVRNWDEAKSMARERGLPPSAIRRAKGLQALDKKLFQYDATAQRLSDKLAGLNAKINSAQFTAKDKAEYLETVLKFQEVSARIFDDQAEIGRALNAMKAISFRRENLANINEILAEYEGNTLSGFADEEIFARFAKQMDGLISSGNTLGAANTVRQVLKPYWWQYALSVRHASMLSSLGTHAKNAYDNLNMIFREMEETALASATGAPVRGALRAGGKEDLLDGVSKEEVVSRAYGIMRALLDSSTYLNTAKAFKEGHGSTPYSSKIEMQDARIPFVSKVNDALFASDTFFRAFHQNANLYALGARQARENGLTGIRAVEEGSARAQNPDQNLMKEAKRLSDTALLVDTPSWLSAKLESVKAIRPNMTPAEQAGAFMANLLFPFFRVTDRLLFQAIRRSPLAFMDKNTRAEFMQGGAARDIAIARAAYGTAIIGYYWTQAGEDGITGKGPDDYRKRMALEAGGWRQNSVPSEDGSKNVDATALNLSLFPLDTQNAIATNIASIKESSMNEEDKAKALASAAQTILSLLGKQSFAENLDPLVGLLQEDKDLQDRAVANFTGDIASQFVPAAARQANQQVFDPFKRDTTGDGSFSDRVTGRVASAVPGLSQDLPMKHDVYGDPIPQGRSTLSINNYTNVKTDPVSKEMHRLEKTSDKTVVTGAPKSFTHLGERVKLPAGAVQEWQRVQGYYLKAWMADEMANPEYKSLSDEEKVDILKQVRKDAYQETKAYMLPLLGLEEEE